MAHDYALDYGEHFSKLRMLSPDKLKQLQTRLKSFINKPVSIGSEVKTPEGAYDLLHAIEKELESRGETEKPPTASEMLDEALKEQFASVKDA